MMRKIIHIDEAKCTGCGMCILACHQSALGLEGGKAKLLREDHCDGLGQCLPMCLAGAISFVEKEVVAEPASDNAGDVNAGAAVASGGGACPGMATGSAAVQWPVQIKLVPPVADFYAGADVLLSADCCAYSYPKFQEEYAAGKVRVIGCPKLDEVDYTEKLSEIFAGNDIASITLARMEVPCCDGIEHAVRRAVKTSGKQIPIRLAVFSVEGMLIYDGE